MRTHLTPLLALAAVTLAPTPVPSIAGDPAPLVVHEWGTFTSIAGPDGTALEWLPLAEQSDLPCFVDRFRHFRPKATVRARVRMETPVIYFYAPQDTTVDVSVEFRRGLVTEWFPSAMVTPAATVTDESLRASGFRSSISWQRVLVRPGGEETFPREPSSSHYYAARGTEAAPIAAGSQREKFLFYRGVGQFPPALSATVDASGTVLVDRLTPDAPRAVTLFENRGGQIGHAVGRTEGDRLSIQRPALTRDLAAVRAELERTLVEHGLFPAEARAMITTWAGAWFEEGTRLLYIVPPAAVDSILPLRIAPRPSHTVRVFVGRLDLMSGGMERDIRQALSTSDRAALATYGRFLRPMVDRVLGVDASAAERVRVETLLRSIAAAGSRPGPECAASTAGATAGDGTSYRPPSARILPISPATLMRAKIQPARTDDSAFE